MPWLVDEESCDVLRAFTRLKHRLMPYLFGVAHEATQTGVPVMRAMVIEHPQDPACVTLDRQSPPRQTNCWRGARLHPKAAGGLPARSGGPGRLRVSGAKRAGDRWHQETHDFLSMPLYVAPTRRHPGGDTDVRPDYDFAHGVTLRVFRLARRRCGRLRRPRARRQHRIKGRVVRAGGRSRRRSARGLDAVEPAGRRAAQRCAGQRRESLASTPERPLGFT